MGLSQRDIDLYHDMDLMPDWVWLQQNGKSAQQNYNYQKQKIYAAQQKKRRNEEIKK